MDLIVVTLKVLVVDDEYFNFEMLELAAGDAFKLIYAESGHDALTKSLEHKPKIILLDVCMPGIDGYDTCRLLKNAPETINIPVIMVTGLENENEKNEAYKAGCDDYVVKPFDMVSLKEKIVFLTRHPQ